MSPLPGEDDDLDRASIMRLQAPDLGGNLVSPTCR
jgi:hypothetical protein